MTFSSQLQGYFWNACETDGSEVFFSLAIQLLCIGFNLSLFVIEISFGYSHSIHRYWAPVWQSCWQITSSHFQWPLSYPLTPENDSFLNYAVFSSSTFTKYVGLNNLHQIPPGTWRSDIQNCDRPPEWLSRSIVASFISPPITSQSLLSTSRNHLTVEIKINESCVSCECRSQGNMRWLIGVKTGQIIALKNNFSHLMSLLFMMKRECHCLLPPPLPASARAATHSNLPCWAKT